MKIFTPRLSTSQASTSPTYGNMVQLKVVQPNGHAESAPLYNDMDVRPKTITTAQQSGIDANFVRLIKKICLLALVQFKLGEIVNSTMLCADIRYGLGNDKPVDGASAPGLSKGERLNAGKVILILANAGELPLVSLGPNKANLQHYRV